jgi:N-acetylglucosamine kinase-like BadF-type ATPase
MDAEEKDMDKLIAMDSGGTKTDTVLFDETGHILYREVSLGCNAMDIGREEAKSRMLEILKRVCGVADQRVKAIYGGIAGTDYFGDFLCEYLRPLVDADKLRIDDDGGCIISGALGRVDGCSMVCGTGSSLLVRVNGRLVRHIGGRGYLIDTGGSGYELGQAAIRHAFRAADGRGEPTVLVALLEREMGCSLSQGVEAIYQRGRAYIASFAHLVFEGNQMGDRICHHIIDEGSTRLAELTWAAEKEFAGEFPVVMNGGIFAAYPAYANLVKAKASPRAQMIYSEVPPVYGSAVEAMADGGLECTEAFRERFLSEYAQWKNGKK